MVNQTQNIKKMAMNVNTLAKNANILAKRIKSMSGGKRKTRRMHRTHHK
jgi:ABC-type iron transport system FetAB ATPase subunit